MSNEKQWKIATQTIAGETIISRGNEGNIFIKEITDDNVEIIADIRLSDKVYDETKKGKYWQTTCKIQDERAALIAQAPTLKAQRDELLAACKFMVRRVEDQELHIQLEAPLTDLYSAIARTTRQMVNDIKALKAENKALRKMNIGLRRGYKRARNLLCDWLFFYERIDSGDIITKFAPIKSTRYFLKIKKQRIL